MPDIKCKNCNILFHETPKRYLRATQHFCSLKCRISFQNSNSEKKEVFCATCKKSCGFKTKKEREPRKNMFCSHPCYGKWRSKALKGSNSPSYVFGYDATYGKQLQSKKWRKLANLIRVRDKFKCVDCKKAQNKRAHHVHHLDRKNGDVPENLITVCASCHSKRHHQVK